MVSGSFWLSEPPWTRGPANSCRTLFATLGPKGPNDSNRGQKINANFFVQSFSKTLRVMDVRAKNRGRPHQKVRFSAAPVMGRNFLTQGRPGARVRNVRWKSGPKSLCLCCFSSLKQGQRIRNLQHTLGIHWETCASCLQDRVRKISPKFSCIKFFQIWDVPTQIPGHPCHSLFKTTEKVHLHKVFVRDIPTSGSRMSQENPAQKLYVYRYIRIITFLIQKHFKTVTVTVLFEEINSNDFLDGDWESMEMKG